MIIIISSPIKILWMLALIWKPMWFQLFNWVPSSDCEHNHKSWINYMVLQMLNALIVIDLFYLHTNDFKICMNYAIPLETQVYLDETYSWFDILVGLPSRIVEETAKNFEKENNISTSVSLLFNQNSNYHTHLKVPLLGTGFTCRLWTNITLNWRCG